MGRERNYRSSGGYYCYCYFGNRWIYFGAGNATVVLARRHRCDIGRGFFMNQRIILTCKARTDSAIAILNGLRKDPNLFEVIIRPYKSSRGLQANAFYWSCVVTPLAKHCGYTPDEMHDEILGSYFGWEQKEIRGHTREFPRRRSSKLNTEEFAGLTSHGQQVAAELNVILPDQADYPYE